MKIMRSVVVSLAMILLSAPVLRGQDLSSTGTSRSDEFGQCFKAVDRQPIEAEVIHQQPALIQELTCIRRNLMAPHAQRSPSRRFSSSSTMVNSTGCS